MTSMLPSFLTSSNNSTTLGSKSTVQDVIVHLNNNDKLASYVPTFTTSQVAEDVPEPLKDSTATDSNTKSVALVTGGNSGIGAEAVKAFAMIGMQVILCARSMDSAKDVVEDLPEYCRDNVTIQKLDLADLDSIQQAVKDIKDQYKGIDVVLQNAGVMAIEERTMTKQGFEMQFGTNHIGHFMLTRLLLPIMRENSRIVTVSSTAQQFADLETSGGWNAFLDGKDQYTPWSAYGNSKLANCMFAKQLQEKLNDEGRGDIQSVSIHPGVVMTGLWKHTSSLLKPLTMVLPDRKTVPEGAATSVYCCLAKNVTGGAYHKDCAEAEPTEPVLNDELRKQLWDYTELQIMSQGYSLPKLLGRPSEDIIADVKHAQQQAGITA